MWIRIMRVRAGAIAALEKYDLVFVHIEAPDEAGTAAILSKRRNRWN